MYIRVNIREIPEIKAAFNSRPNKKDSFVRWYNKVEPNLSFHDGSYSLEMIAS